MPELAYVNGTITSINEARVPIEDRGYQFGDAVYEFFATYRGAIFAFEEHLDRLERSMRELKFPAMERDKIGHAIKMLLQRSTIARAGIYLQISRGVAPRNHPFPKEVSPQLVITVRQAPDIPESVRREGAKAITIRDIRWGRCDIKTVQLLPNVLAKQQAVEAGVQDAIFISDEGIVREGTSSNLFIVKDGELTTHPRNDQILPGITRHMLLLICKEAGIAVKEDFFRKEEMMAADEVFLTGTVTEVLPLVQIDGKTIGDGKVGPLAQRLLTLLRERAGA